ncbi:MAG: glycosyltransferase family 2 protein [Candidatus Altiarchaeota archaeon]
MVRTAVIIPALNEEKSIGKVVKDFRREIPDADIIVYNNNSTDGTVEAAKKAGAKVLTETRRGKGFVMKSALDNIDADYYVFVDGDDTYPAEDVKNLLKPVLDGECDMTVGSRIGDKESDSMKRLHVFGNWAIVTMINTSFGMKLEDVLSGYRVLNRNLAKHLNLISSGFEIETELTIRTLIENFRIKEVPIRYRSRPKGSESKLDSFSDGFIILWTIITLLRDYRPMFLFSILSIVSLTIGLIISILSLTSTPYSQMMMLSLIASLSFIILGIQFIAIGLILHSIRSQNILLDQLIRRQLK